MRLVIMQGDQYAIPMSLKVGNVYKTPENVYEMIIRVGDTEKKYSSGDILFDYETHQWLFPIKYEDSKKYNSNVKVQMQWQENEGEFIRHTDVKVIDIDLSIIRGK